MEAPNVIDDYPDECPRCGDIGMDAIPDGQEVYAELFCSRGWENRLREMLVIVADSAVDDLPMFGEGSE